VNYSAGPGFEQTRVRVQLPKANTHHYKPPSQDTFKCQGHGQPFHAGQWFDVEDCLFFFKLFFSVDLVLQTEVASSHFLSTC